MLPRCRALLSFGGDSFDDLVDADKQRWRHVEAQLTTNQSLA
jgi:hypothetical protein